jgi:hypothetical protein
MRVVWVDLISVVMVIFIVIVDAKGNPFAATLPPTVDRQAMGWIWLGEDEEDDGPDGAMAAGAADNRYSAGGLISAIAVRWRANFGSFG